MTLKKIYELRKETVNEDLVEKIGWTEIVLSPEEIMRKTMYLVNAMKRGIGSYHLESSAFWNNVNFEASNRKDSQYGKTFDRMVFSNAKAAYTVISSMTGSGAKFLVFEHGKAIPLAKLKSVDTLGEFLYRKLS